MHQGGFIARPVRLRAYNRTGRAMWLYVSLYLVGVAGGVLANIVFDVQLRRPGIREAVGLVVFLLLLWGAISVTHTAFQDVLLPIVWAGTGLLAGFGSRGGAHVHR